MARPELVLILGGARSGKSEYAEQLATGYGSRVIYVATAQSLDDEMQSRIQRHQSQRRGTWTTVESPTGVGGALLAAQLDADAILVDCVTLLVSNIVLSFEGWAQTHPSVSPEAGDSETLPASSETEVEAAVSAEIDALLETQAQLGLPMVVVSNEVGMGLVPPYPLGRVYRDVLGRANQRLAAVADRVFFLVAGLPVALKG
jgi:adenosylcobinamide kinase/adenosylcobinamide-phosphate guanylyltransferase